MGQVAIPEVLHPMLGATASREARYGTAVSKVAPLEMIVFWDFASVGHQSLASKHHPELQGAPYVPHTCPMCAPRVPHMCLMCAQYAS